MATAKNTSVVTEAQAARTTLPKKKGAAPKAIAPNRATRRKSQAVEVVEPAAPAVTHEPSLGLLIVDDKALAARERRLVNLSVQDGLHAARSERSAEKLATEYLELRRSFPAIEKVREILGEDAPDLAGRSPEYKDAIGRINESAKDALVAELRKDGFTLRFASDRADAEAERIRKSVTRYVRIMVENEAKAILATQGREAAATFILGHGFGYSGEVTSKSYKGVVESKEWKLHKDEATGATTLSLPPGKVISENGRDVTDAVQQAEPVEQSDQTPPSETADSEITALLKAAGVTIGDPVGIINLAVGLMNGATDLVKAPDTKLSIAQRNALRKLVNGAGKGLLEALAGLPAQVAEAIATK